LVGSIPLAKQLAKKAPPPIALIEPRRVYGRRGWGRKNRRESRKTVLVALEYLAKGPGTRPGAIEQVQCWLLAIDPLLIEAMTIIVSSISAIMIIKIVAIVGHLLGG
jgi:hypothetical protein